ncbi:MAG: outer membrane lipoprotein-sorting protein [Candidatus Dadabacteria bacterium]|nr:MAG: outer membrane lipoprotein-sorting protein [Candidatus Dadabacteria bacterium]
MFRKFLLMLAATVVASPFVVRAEAPAEDAVQRGNEIASLVEHADDGFKGERSELELVLLNAQGDKVVRKMNATILEGENGEDRSLFEFVFPTDVRGTKLLTWSHPKGNDDQWLYLPAIKRVKRIAATNQSGSFMGSEFSYEDFGSRAVEKYRNRYLGDEVVNGRNTWIIEQVPVNRYSGYSRMKVWIDQEFHLPIRTEYYDRRGDLLKVAHFEQPQQYRNFWRAGQITMENVQTRKKSVMTWTSRQLFLDLDPDDFTVDALAD